MGWVIFVLVCFALLVVAALIKGAHDGAVLADQTAEFTASHNAWDVYVSPYDRSLIALDREHSQVVFGSLSSWKQYGISDIVSVELLRDGASITSTNRGSQAAGALIGGLALGGVGLLLGGLSGSKKNIATLHSVGVKVIVDDRAAPVYVIDFFRSPSKKGTEAHSSTIKPALENADRYHALLVAALRSQNDGGASNVGKADEIKKLWDLKVAGALSDEEFASQKAKLLSGRSEDTALARS